MMTYEVKTPALSRVVDLAFSAIDGIKSGTMERADANAISSQLGRVVSAVGADVKVRTAALRIAAQEAKLIEQEQRRQIEAQ